MNSIVPYPQGLPATVGTRFRAIEPDPMSLRHLLGIIWSRARTAGLVALVLFAGVILYTAQRPEAYFAAGTVEIQPKRQNLTTPEQDPNAPPPDTGAIDTQVEVLRSPAVAEIVVRKLKLYQDGEFRPKQPLFGKPLPQEEIISRTVQRVQSRTQIRRVGLTYVVQVGFVSGSPQKAQRIANALMQAYMDHQLDQKTQDIIRANSELSSNVETLRREAATAEAALQQYRVDHGLLSAEGSTMAEMEVSTLNTQIAQAKADRAEKQARLQAALGQISRGSGGADVGAALSSNTIKDLRTREAEVSVRLAELKSRFTDSYPEVQRAQAELADIRGQIQQELNRIVSSLRAEAQAAAQRESSLLASRAAAQGGLAANGRAQVGLVELQQRADAAKSIYDGYLNRAKELAVEASLQQPDAAVTGQAVLPTQPFTPNWKVAIAFAIALALAGAAATILVLELWDRRLRSRNDVESRLGVAFAGVLPDIRSIEPVKQSQNPAAAAEYLVKQPFTSFAEAFRNLGVFLRLSENGSAGKVIALTSAIPKEGKSLSSYCLARTMALAGSQVVLVDCDLRQRGVSKLSGEAEKGIVEVVAGDAPLDEALLLDAASGCWVLPASGKTLPFDLFSKVEFDAVLKSLVERFDYVIIDTPPILGVADARILCAKSDSVLYVAEWNKTPVRMAQSAMDILHESGANVVGAVLSKVDVKQQARYGYGDSSDYFQYYRDYYVTAA